MIEAFRFWVMFIRLGHEFWSRRHIWTTISFLEATSQTDGPLAAMAQAYLLSIKGDSPGFAAAHQSSKDSIADEVTKWLAGRDRVNEEDGA